MPEPVQTQSRRASANALAHLVHFRLCEHRVSAVSLAVRTSRRLRSGTDGPALCALPPRPCSQPQDFPLPNGTIWYEFKILQKPDPSASTTSTQSFGTTVPKPPPLHHASRITHRSPGTHPIDK